MDSKKENTFYIIPEIKPIVKKANKKVTIEQIKDTSSSEMYLLKEVNQKLDLLLTSLNISKKE